MSNGKLPKGKKSCSKCSGTGKVMKISQVGGGQGYKVTCPKCGGSGMV